MRTRTQPLYKLMASAIDARKRCDQTGNTEWFSRWSDLLHSVEKDLLPRGSGIDSGTAIDLDRSTGDRLVLSTAFHHMNDAGCYAGWTEHTITVAASMIHTIDLKISGRNRNEIKEYLADVFSTALTDDVIEAYDEDTQKYTLSFARYAQQKGA